VLMVMLNSANRRSVVIFWVAALTCRSTKVMVCGSGSQRAYGAAETCLQIHVQRSGSAGRRMPCATTSRTLSQRL